MTSTCARSFICSIADCPPASSLSSARRPGSEDNMIARNGYRKKIGSSTFHFRPKDPYQKFQYFSKPLASFLSCNFNKVPRDPDYDLLPLVYPSPERRLSFPVLKPNMGPMVRARVLLCPVLANPIVCTPSTTVSHSRRGLGLTPRSLYAGAFLPPRTARHEGLPESFLAAKLPEILRAESSEPPTPTMLKL